ncbi:LIM zinc-binding domain-containing protein [Heracleum sosnowskyi]|uniref:LIM zinc-binding domain-containing protein n=1 Tax=Heracleum sosnowskyi TaxID=360622 RepID=A0AAD8N2F8_9APIA|nr:LIM zinc-binding domain-containing protein [Heracleum sosnowskyi]
MEGESYHKPCFKCAHGGCPLTHSSYAALDGILYCKHHFAQLFLEKGNYHHVLEAAKIKSAVAPVEPEEVHAEGTSEEKAEEAAAEEPSADESTEDKKPEEES